MIKRYSYGNTIDTADDLALDRMGAGAIYKDMIVRQLNALKLESLIETLNSKPIGKKVYARIDCSRWIADCDYCGGAMAVNPNKSFFFCVTCLNVKNDNRPRPVVFPDNYKEIEIELQKREKPMNRNWNVTETVEMLKAEVQ